MWASAYLINVLQVNQERLLMEYSLSRAEVQVGQMEKLLAQQNQSKEHELHALREEIASLNKVITIQLNICSLYCKLYIYTNSIKFTLSVSRGWRNISENIMKFQSFWWRETDSTRNFRGCSRLGGYAPWKLPTKTDWTRRPTFSPLVSGKIWLRESQVEEVKAQERKQRESLAVTSVVLKFKNRWRE